MWISYILIVLVVLNCGYLVCVKFFAVKSVSLKMGYVKLLCSKQKVLKHILRFYYVYGVMAEWYDM